MAYTPRSQGEILSNLKGSVIGRTEVNDIFVGSTLYNLLNSFAGEIASIERRLFTIREQFFLNGAEGQDLDDRIAELPPIGLTRIPETNASGSVLTITRSDAIGDLTIPSGSSVLSSEGTRFVTTTDNIIPNGSLSIENVHILCTSAGQSGNKVLGDIFTIDNMPSEVTEVLNTSPLTNGQDLETDQELRDRAYSHLKSLSRCQRNAIETMAVSYIGVDGDRFRYARIFEDHNLLGYSELVVDDGSGMNIQSISRAGQTVSGVIPSAGSYFIYHEAPATLPISANQITVLDSSNAPVTVTSNDFTSIPERGMIYFSDGFLQGGYQWTISNYRVFRGLIKEIQEEIEGDVDNPSKLTGFRAVGTRIRVVPPTVIHVDMSIALVIDIGSDFKVVERDVSIATADAISFLNVGEPLYISKLIDVIVNLTGVRDVKILELGSLTQRLDNVIPQNARTVLRVGTITISSIEG
tara:strand:+ start:783 stop:2183 length:1401 start_codon:yes stop_codon:yes gene_type:complete